MTRVRRHAEFFSNTKLIESQLSEAPVASNDRKTYVHRCFLHEEMPHALTCMPADRAGTRFYRQQVLLCLFAHLTLFLARVF